jgi:hypothetical protein
VIICYVARENTQRIIIFKYMKKFSFFTGNEKMLEEIKVKNKED